MMSKQDKERAETADAAELAAESVMSEGDAHSLPLAVQTEPASGQAEQSLMFNSWLDRTLPRLMQYLGAGTTSAVTSPGSKAKH
jgi:hypothetical protein